MGDTSGVAEPEVIELAASTSDSPPREAEGSGTGTLSELSHELRAPLASIQNYCEILLRYPPDDDDKRESFLQTVADEAERLNRLLADLIALERLQSGAPGVPPAPCDLRDVTRRAILNVHGLTQSREISLRIEEPAGPIPPVMSDPQQLVRAVTALVDNAAKFAHERSTVLLRILPDPTRSTVDLEIENTGVRIPPECAEHIFDKFYRAPLPAEATRFSGSGLGLTLARTAARLRGGDLTYRPTAGGALFRLSLPAGLSDDATVGPA